MPTVSVQEIDYARAPMPAIAKDLIYQMAEATGAPLDWLPYTLDIPSYRGSAEVDDQGHIISENRTPHQWRQVRYAYMDCRREANKRGLILRGTQKIWDSSIAAIGLLWAQLAGRPPSPAQLPHRSGVRALLAARTGYRGPGGRARRAGGSQRGGRGLRRLPGRSRPRRAHDAVRAEAAEDFGIFGVPSFVIDGELFWGKEHLPAIKERLSA